MSWMLMKTDIGVCARCGCSKHEGPATDAASFFRCRDCGVPTLFVWKTTREPCEAKARTNNEAR